MKRTLLTIALTAVCSMGFAQQTQTLQWRIENMHCDRCAHKVMTALTQDSGVADVDIDVERRVATVSYDPAKTSPTHIQQQLSGTKYEPTAYDANAVILREKSYRIDDMHCGKCAHRISVALDDNKAIDSLDFDIEKHTVYVRYDANKTSRNDILATLNGLGFTPVSLSSHEFVAYTYLNLPEDAAAPATYDEAMDIDGVVEVNVNSRRKVMAVSYNSKKLTQDQLLEALKTRGVAATVPPPHVCKEAQP